MTFPATETATMSRRSLLALAATVVAGCTSGTASAPASVGPEPATTGPPDTPTTTATTGATATTTASTTASTPEPPPPTTALLADPFLLGVAAGDPDAASVVIWTRLVGDELRSDLPVDFEVAADADFGEIVTSGSVTAALADGHAVHVTVEAAGPIWYRFRAGGFTSPAGRAAPAPPTSGGPAELRIASASCQHFETGYYAAHRDLAEWAPDLVVFLGDFLYEGASRPVGGEVVRSHAGAEPTDLAGYRARYAQYLGDPDLRAARSACPWVAIWDDHEVENNYAGDVPQDPADAAVFAARRTAAYRAWWEHMPVRLPPPTDGAPFEIHRTVRWGRLAELVMLDGRQFRTDQACGSPFLSLDPPCPEASDPARTMLGSAQEEWLGSTLATVEATWAVIAQQTVLSDVRLDGAILNYDQWDGYAPARDRLLLQAAQADRVVVLTGDIHLAGAGVLPGVGVELVTTSISSTGLEALGIEALPPFETIVDIELAHRGYTRHTVTADAWTAEYRIVGDVTRADSPVSTWRTFRVDATAPDVVHLA